jgi:hypothetical protein
VGRVLSPAPLPFFQREKEMKPTYQILQAALITACYYHPIQQMKELIPKLRRQEKFVSSDSVVGDTFAGLYINVFRFPPDEYEEWRTMFFSDGD